MEQIASKQRQLPRVLYLRDDPQYVDKASRTLE
jgi:hypothetical protein